jgi:hypothetical protein
MLPCPSCGTPITPIAQHSNVQDVYCACRRTSLHANYWGAPGGEELRLSFWGAGAELHAHMDSCTAYQYLYGSGRGPVRDLGDPAVQGWLDQLLLDLVAAEVMDS